MKDFEDLVIMKNNQAITSSLRVAEKFGKEHRNILKAARNLTAQNVAVKKCLLKAPTSTNVVKSNQ